MSLKGKKLATLYFLIPSLILGLPLFTYFIEQHNYLETEEDFFLMKINQGRVGSFFFDENSDFHNTYKYFNPSYGSDFGWTILDYGKRKLEISSIFMEEDLFYLDISIIKGIKHKEWYYIFASGQTGLWSPVTIGMRSKDMENWEPVPSFNPSSSSPIFRRFVDVCVDANDNLVACFSDASGMISGIPYYSFYLLNITETSWEIETITFEGDLGHLRTANFILWNNNPTICWSFYNASLHYNILNLTTRKNGIWVNNTVTYTNQSLNPCGLKERNGQLDAYFYGHNFDGPTNETSYTKTKLYKATISDIEITSDELFYYPERLFFSDRSVHEWKNGKHSFFFQIDEEIQRLHYYAELLGDNLTLFEVKANLSSARLYSYSLPQLIIKNDFIYLLWAEVIFLDTDDPDIYNLYFARFSDVQGLETLTQIDPVEIETPLNI